MWRRTRNQNKENKGAQMTHCKIHDNIFDDDDCCRLCKDDISSKISRELRKLEEQKSRLEVLQDNLRLNVKDTDDLTGIIREFDEVLK